MSQKIFGSHYHTYSNSQHHIASPITDTMFFVAKIRGNFKNKLCHLTPLIETSKTTYISITKEENSYSRVVSVIGFHLLVAGSKLKKLNFSNFYEIFCICPLLVVDQFPVIIFSYIGGLTWIEQRHTYQNNYI
jgi:hypothetical protein